MPALNFMQRLAPLVESGEKTHTIRQVRKRPICVGDRLYLYTGMRTKACRKLGEATCIRIQKIAINRLFDLAAGRIDNKSLTLFEFEILAIRDGLDSAKELTDFLEKKYGLPFVGVLIHWELD